MRAFVLVYQGSRYYCKGRRGLCGTDIYLFDALSSCAFRYQNALSNTMYAASPFERLYVAVFQVTCRHLVFVFPFRAMTVTVVVLVIVIVVVVVVVVVLVQLRLRA